MQVETDLVLSFLLVNQRLVPLFSCVDLYVSSFIIERDCTLSFKLINTKIRIVFYPLYFFWMQF